MDGTLLNSKHQVSPRFFKQFEALKQKGILFVAASGRQYDSMEQKLDPIKDDVIFIAENGALTRFQGECLQRCEMPKEGLNEVLQVVLQAKGVHPVLCCSHTAYALDRSPAFANLIQEYYTTATLVKDLSTVTDPVLKLALYHFRDSERFVYPHVAAFEDRFKVKVSGAHWVDVSHMDAHKGHALQAVMKDKGIAPEEVLAFGDFNNDAEMLALTPYSVAMANAHPNIKAIAQYTTTSNDDHGVERVLDLLVPPD